MTQIISNFEHNLEREREEREGEREGGKERCHLYIIRCLTEYFSPDFILKLNLAGINALLNRVASEGIIPVACRERNTWN